MPNILIRQNNQNISYHGRLDTTQGISAPYPSIPENDQQDSLITSMSFANYFDRLHVFN